VRGTPPSAFGALDPTAALALVLADALLASAALPVAPDALAPLAERARAVLDVQPADAIGAFARRFRVVPPGPPSAPAAVAPSVLEAVTGALAASRQLAITYRTGQRADPSYVLQPLGLVWRGDVLQLVGRTRGEGGPRTFLLPRVRTARVLDEPIEDTWFVLDAFIEAGGLGGFPAPIELVARARGEAALRLTERPLRRDQTVEALARGEVRVRAVVADTPELRGLLLSMGDEVLVEEPKTLARDIARTLRAAVERYKAAARRRPQARQALVAQDESVSE
jgi:predicted DNA-binding transcriptional regulator YafY